MDDVYEERVDQVEYDPMYISMVNLDTRNHSQVYLEILVPI